MAIDGKIKIFQEREIEAALQYALDGGVAVHLHTFNMGKEQFKKYKELCHLIDYDEDRLIALARILGVKRISVQRRGERGQHIDIFGKPLVILKSMVNHK